MVAEICDSDNRPRRVRSVLAGASERLDRAGVSAPQREARLLLRWAASLDPVALSLAEAEDRLLPDDVLDRLEHGVSARAERRPLSHIQGGRWFFGRWFEVTPAVLDPRPESETLVAAALEHLRPDAPAADILDLGVGSGCLLLSVLAERPAARGLGVDASLPALAVAERNARALGLADRARFAAGNWLDGVSARFDAILCNPPYIPRDEWRRLAPEVRQFEPEAALTPGPDGLAPYRALAPRLAARLKPDGCAFFEVGLGQADAVRALFEAAALSTRTYEDLDGRPRVVSAMAGPRRE